MKTLQQLIKDEGITTVAELFEKHPERWIHGQNRFAIKDAEGRWVEQFKDGCQACLGAAIRYVYDPELAYTGKTVSTVYDKGMLARTEIAVKWGSKYSTIPEWNDLPERTVDDVITVAKLAGI